ncbi:hypothetical protein GQ53DRAFT_118254 [Thozetella sp. PMI_491]|nr:hypothetical protein GQ53DRAFT_118254 [Thozetella sp. PMI_491]
MAAKMKAHPLNGMHTAGIFSDMSIDGPQIGTLVLVVDRAKNLPNRKTIGKQDPYCAARLGKEAKKTTTDIRGGQTPKWDQELRFIVHDSADYYQLKVSVFNDDKKTELIGESWIDLRDIIVAGGGQSDQWHQLACRGKYAGEVRIEITFYDSRPKPEKPVVKARQPGSSEVDGSAPSAAGPRAMPKRRPLPSDPITGKAPAQASPEHETPPRAQPNPPVGYIPNQSPLQQVEYHTPPSGRLQQQDHYSPAPTSAGYPTPNHRSDPYRTPERSNAHDDRGYSPGHQGSFSGHPDSMGPDSFELPSLDDRGVSPDDDRPPPPPVHRVRNNSGGGMSPVHSHHGSFDAGMAKGTLPASMRHDVLRNEAHRHSASTSFPSAYPGKPTYRSQDSAPAALQSSQYSHGDYSSSGRHHSYDASYDSHRSMQPTVEDVPESPEDMNSVFRRSGSRIPPPQPPSYFEPEFEPVGSPAPLSLSGRHSAGPSNEYGSSRDYASPREYTSPHEFSPSTELVPHRRQGSSGYMPQDAPVTSRSLPRGSQPSSFGTSTYGRNSEQKALEYRSELSDTSPDYTLPSIPSSLVPGVDRSITHEVVKHFREEQQHQRRYTQPPPMETPPRGRQLSETPQAYGFDSSPASHGAPGPQSRSPITYSGGPSPVAVVNPRAVSPNPAPNPNHTIRRKSISPQPPPAEGRRLSGIPFGPDSYNEFNPTVVASAIQDITPSRSSDYNEKSGKIITHDGREVDPSDHLPVESWAPEPEPKLPALPTRPSPGTSQAMVPSSGRRPLRIAGRPQSMVPIPNPPQYALPDPSDPSTPSPLSTASRNRLQKKVQHRASVAPVMSGANGPGLGSGSTGSSPLAPLPLHSHQDNFTPPRVSRASTFDSYASMPNENYAPPSMYGGSPGSSGGFRNSYGAGGSGPPIPAKVPLALPAPPGPNMSGALQLHDGRGSGGYGSLGSSHGRAPSDPWGAGGGTGQLSLMEELQRIDIGTGRSRRHGSGY